MLVYKTIWKCSKLMKNKMLVCLFCLFADSELFCQVPIASIDDIYSALRIDRDFFAVQFKITRTEQLWRPPRSPATLQRGNIVTRNGCSQKCLVLKPNGGLNLQVQNGLILSSKERLHFGLSGARKSNAAASRENLSEVCPDGEQLQIVSWV